MCTITKQRVEGMCHEQFSWTSSQEPWTAFGQGPSDNCSGQIILSSDKPVRATIGRKVITPRVPNSSIACWMWGGKKQRVAIVCKASSCATLLAVALAQEWEPF